MSQLNPYQLYWENLRKYWPHYPAGLIAMLVTSTSEVLLPKFIRWALDALYKPLEQLTIPPFFRGPSSSETLDNLVFSLLIILSLGWLGRIGWRQILARQTHLAGHEIKTRIWSSLKDQPLSLLDKYSLGDLMNRATGDWNKTRFIHGFTLVLTFDLIFFSILAIISMFLIDKLLALACLCIIPFLPKKIVRISKKEYILHQHAQEQLSTLSELIAQTIKTIRLQRATATESLWIEKLEISATEYAKRQFEVLKCGWHIFNWAAIPTIFAYLVLFTLGIWKIQKGEITLGEFIALQSYVVLLQSPLFELGSLISEWQTGFASYKRITEIFDLEKPKAETQKETTPAPMQSNVAVSMTGVSYSFNQSKQALENLNLDVFTGQKIGLLGRIGSGKSTLINLVAGLLENPQGDIRIFGRPIQECDRDWFVKNISMVPQKPFLFAGTILQNLNPKGNYSTQEVFDILEKVDLWRDIQSFPDGINSSIGEAGINLSGGQKQRIALARALLKPCPLILIDDGLSAVDSITEARILASISPYLANRAVIWSAHRISTLQLCDEVFLMENGELKPYLKQTSSPHRSLFPRPQHSGV
jgi:ATP-binding cassette subfamily B multidrug efflux pump